MDPEPRGSHAPIRMLMNKHDQFFFKCAEFLNSFQSADIKIGMKFRQVLSLYKTGSCGIVLAHLTGFEPVASAFGGQWFYIVSVIIFSQIHLLN